MSLFVLHNFLLDESLCGNYNEIKNKTQRLLLNICPILDRVDEIDRGWEIMKKEYRNAVRTKKMIRSAFSELLGEKKVIEMVTVGELCDRADIAKSTFYNHYNDVYAVAEEFENELLARLSAVLDEVECDQATEYEVYIRKILAFLIENETIYRQAMATADARYIVEKMKTLISKKIFEESEVLPFSNDRAKRYIQIRILTNACVDTVADYFRGIISASLDEVGDSLVDFINRLSK